jgi:hypothetical protein
MKRVFYEKVGRRYRPVAEYDSDLMDAFTMGDHLVSRRKGITSRRPVTPAFAPMIAAGLYAHDAMVRALHRALELQAEPKKLTARQRELVDALTASMNGQDARWIRASAYDVAESGVQALVDEAQRLMSNQAVRDAYEQFLMVCELTKGNKDEVV